MTRVEGKAGQFDILDDIDAGMIVIDAHQRIRHWNRWVQERTALRADKVSGCPLWDVLPSVQNMRLREAVEDALGAGTESFLSHSLHGLIFPLRCYDHRPLLHDVVVRPVDHLPEPHCLIQIKDATERRHAQEALADSRKRYQATFDNAGVGVCECDLTGRYLRVNNRLCEVLGYSREELLARRFEDITHPEDRERSVAEVRRLLTTPAWRFSLEKRYLHKNGSIVSATLTCSVVRDADGRADYLVATIEDISSRKRAEAERERLIHQQDLLMRETHHRVKNSLALVASMLSVQSRRIHDPERRAPLADAYQRVLAVAHLHERLYQGCNGNEIDLDSLLKGLCADLQQSVIAVEGGLTLVVESDTRILIAADKALSLALVVSELVTNAAKYAHPDGSPGTVTIRCSRSGEDALSLCVRDDGVGLPPDFDPARSNGFGMSIIRSLADQLGGTLSFQAGGPGMAACLSIPVVD